MAAVTVLDDAQRSFLRAALHSSMPEHRAVDVRQKQVVYQGVGRGSKAYLP